MKRRLPKYLIDLAKADLKEDIVSRVIKNANDRGCWHLKSVNEKGIVDAVCHFRDKGTKRIFFKARRLVFELIKGDSLGTPADDLMDPIPKDIASILRENGLAPEVRQEQFESAKQGLDANCGYCAVYNALKMHDIEPELSLENFIKEERSDKKS